MKTSKQDRRMVMLTDYLMLAEKASKLGWAFGCINQDSNRGVSYLLFNIDVSRRRRKNNISLEFHTIDLTWGFMSLIESGLKEKIVLGELDHAPSFDVYREMVRRLGVHGCRLSGEMDFDRMTIGYRIWINEDKLLFNQWEDVIELVKYLDSGDPTKASVSIKTAQINTMKEVER